MGDVPSPLKNFLKDDFLHEDNPELPSEDMKVFEPSLSLQLFNLDTVHKLARITIEDFSLEDPGYIYDLIQTIALEFGSEDKDGECAALHALFWLISIVKEDFIQDCRDCMNAIDSDIKLKVKDIIAVFINWGATLKTLRIDDLMLEKEFEFCTLPEVKPLPHEEASRGTIITRRFSNRTLEIILETIVHRLPTTSDNWESESKILLKALITASLDCEHLGTGVFYSSVFGAILNSYSEWNITKAQELVVLLNVGANDASFIAHTLLLGGLDTRSEELAKCVALKYVQVTTQTSASPRSLPDGLPQAADLLESASTMITKHSYKTLSTLVDLLMVLVERYDWQCIKNTQEENEVMVTPIKKLHLWSIEARAILRQHPHKYVMAGNHLYVKTNRLTAFTAAMLKNTFGEAALSSNINRFIY